MGAGATSILSSTTISKRPSSLSGPVRSLQFASSTAYKFEGELEGECNSEGKFEGKGKFEGEGKFDGKERRLSYSALSFLFPSGSSSIFS